jgi:aminoglycoside phosphotransferase (APT) family kinase protein
VDWLLDPSEGSLREAVASAVPALAAADIELQAEFNTSNPEWCAGTVIVGRAFVAKAAWSEPAAIRVLREARVLAALADAAPELPIPSLLGMSVSPVGFVTRLVEGVPLGHNERPPWPLVALELAGFLARLHRPALLPRVEDEVPGLVGPCPQATTDAIRLRLPRFLDVHRAELACRWCEWVDEILASPSPQQVLARGDLHGYNQVWGRSTWKLRLVADFEMSGPADPEYDLRYFPPVEPTLGFVRSVSELYAALTGSSLDIRRVMAWHVRTALGDALWRSEADVPRPAGCTPASYVDDLRRRGRPIFCVGGLLR